MKNAENSKITLYLMSSQAIDKVAQVLASDICARFPDEISVKFLNLKFVIDILIAKQGESF